ncbi:MAG: hypothetical protein EAZ57_07175 [Cytophagales bacterium]|nr:MAG: hypothetical protein EAZ67_07985 [Cytophagales bacterium]TAF60483.1 MAG: hypothetical protein EAZ57_07175 [Cytophagales bacterium]
MSLKMLDFKQHRVWLLGLLNLFFFIFLMFLGYFAPITNEDFCFLDILENEGFLGSIKWWFTQWQGRLSAYLLIQLTLILYDLTGSIWGYIAFVCLFFITGFVAVFYRLSQLKDHLTISKALLAAFFVQGVLVLFFEFHTLLRLNVSAMYFGGMGFLCWALAALKRSQNHPYSVFWIFGGCFMAFCAACSSEAFGLNLVLWGALGCVLTYTRTWPQGWHALNGRPLKAAFILWTSALLGLLTMLFAPGTAIRREQFKAATSLIEFIQTLLASLKLFVYSFLARPLPEVFLLASFIVLMSAMACSLLDKHKLVSKQLIFWIPCAMLVLLTSTIVPTVYALQNIGPHRALVLSFAIFLGFGVWLGFILFQIWGQKWHEWLAYSASILLLIQITWRLSVAFPTVQAYKQAQDRLLAKLVAEYRQTPTVQNPYPYERGHTVRVAPLPKARPYLFEQWLVEDSSHWAHHCLCDGLNLNVKIRVDSTLNVGEVKE